MMRELELFSSSCTMNTAAPKTGRPRCGPGTNKFKKLLPAMPQKILKRRPSEISMIFMVLRLNSIHCSILHNREKHYHPEVSFNRSSSSFLSIPVTSTRFWEDVLPD